MPRIETISAKQAATTAETHDQHIRWAIKRGFILARRKGGRLFIDKQSFDEWRKLLEIRRQLRQREQELVKP
jgi:hypothetical protein